MRQVLRGYGPGTTMCLVGAILLLAGTSAGLGYMALQDQDAKTPPGAREEKTQTGGLELTATVGLDAPLVPLDTVSANAQPPLVNDAPLPGTSVERELGIDRGRLGCGGDFGADGVASLPQPCFGVDASLDLASGSRRIRDTGADGDASTSTARTTTLPPAAAPAAVAAAAFTLAGIAAYFWTSIKTWAAGPLVGLYAKISRAEVFDNSVRERIFQAIRANPGLSASDLARLGDVSWGTTIYHLDVLEQTCMVSSIRRGRYRRYFENGAALATSKDAVAVLRNTVTANVVETLRSRPGVTQKELAAATNMSPQALHWHLARLVETGLIRKEREGRVVRHFASAN